jgi:hypothetical protein
MFGMTSRKHDPTVESKLAPQNPSMTECCDLPYQSGDGYFSASFPLDLLQQISSGGHPPAPPPPCSCREASAKIASTNNSKQAEIAVISTNISKRVNRQFHDKTYKKHQTTAKPETSANHNEHHRRNRHRDFGSGMSYHQHQQQRQRQ